MSPRNILPLKVRIKYRFFVNVFPFPKIERTLQKYGSASRLIANCRIVRSSKESVILIVTRQVRRRTNGTSAIIDYFELECETC